MDECLTFDADATVDELLNRAAEWLQYARGVTDLLVESMQETELPDRQRMALALGAVSTLTAMGTRCAMRAHGRMQWDKV
ncbi:hypothetical protein L2Y94_18115 [Luteibacter aegosomatis]|uniref:hypothetical protein n=1 Tax=Luteibacter aegosomatis TaxID=2911537 RepID=UPI001FFB3304|nr:hypothetical protein [Luteibacter aegosomatis]UPG85202.1 hypothetical protein L2Y94_18115 [Luteibacter aegosomatis]